MNQHANRRAQVAKLIFDRFSEVLERLDRIEQQQSETAEQITEMADSLDELDRWRRPYGDGTRPSRRRPRR